MQVVMELEHYLINWMKENGNQWHFFFKTLDAAQRKYSTFDHELLAVFLSLKHFKHILQGRDLNIVTDHQPLVKAFRSTKDNFTPR